jgi:predicted MFS family arabinose efflux permease
MTVPPNVVGLCVLLAVTWSSDHFRERTYHICFALTLSLVSLIILATIDVATHKGVGYFAMFLLAAGAYIPSCLVHSWHNNNNLSENARAVTTGILVGIGNLGGILSSATFRVQYAPDYIPMLAATAASAATSLTFVLGFGLWMKKDNHRRDREQGAHIRAEDVDTDLLNDEKDVNWRWFT